MCKYFELSKCCFTSILRRQFRMSLSSSPAPTIHWQDGTLVRLFSLRHVLKEVDSVFHCAATVSHSIAYTYLIACVYLHESGRRWPNEITTARWRSTAHRVTQQLISHHGDFLLQLKHLTEYTLKILIACKKY